MKCFKYMKVVFVALVCAGIMTTATVCLENTATAAPAPAQQTAVQAPKTQAQEVYTVTPLTLVNSPKTYLNKSIVMQAKFDKFSTLGLDYKPAYKSSDNYISFLIKRPDTNFDIPLSEMKLFLKREMAEKYIDIKTNDEIEIKGNVFSDALGDTWVDVQELKITKKAPEETKE